jgi:gliding motility-associated-like protein
LFDRAKFTVSDSIVCAGDAPVQLITDRLTGLFWGRNVKGNQFIVDTNSGNFTVYYAIQNEFCADTTSIQIQVKAKPDASFYFEDSIVCLGNTPVVIHCKNNGGLLKGMFLNDGNFIPQKIGDYTITYELKNDFCIDSTSQTIHVIDGSDLQIPNVFSPNEDGKNDVFKVLGVSNEKFQLSIFNRWGQLLFESNNPLVAWDGKYNAESVPEGVYFYLIQAQDECHQPYNLRGTVQVLR